MNYIKIFYDCKIILQFLENIRFYENFLNDKSKSLLYYFVNFVSESSDQESSYKTKSIDK